MKKRYIALGSVVMFLLLLRNKKPKELTVEQVGPVIVHGEDEKKDVEIRVEPLVPTHCSGSVKSTQPVVKPVVMADAVSKTQPGISTTSKLSTDEIILNKLDTIAGKYGEVGIVKKNPDSVVTTTETVASGVTTAGNGVGGNVSASVDRPTRPTPPNIVETVVPTPEVQPVVVVPPISTVPPPPADDRGNEGISTTTGVSTGDAIINKLDGIINSDDEYTRWVRDEERKNRERNGGLVVEESSSYDNGRDPEDFVNLFSDSDMLGWIRGTIDTSTIILPDESEDSTIGSDYGRNVLSSLNEYVAKVNAGGSASDAARNVTEYLDHVKARRQEREVYISRGGLTRYDTMVLDRLNIYYDRVLNFFKNVNISG